MTDDVPGWSTRSALISVSDLERSVGYYKQVMNLQEVFREDQMSVLGGNENGPITLYLRQGQRNAAHPGHQALGIRSIAFEVGSTAELDRVEQRLRELNAFRNRQTFPDHERYEVVFGHDPDRFALAFVATSPGEKLTLDDYHRVLALMYAMDL